MTYCAFTAGCQPYFDRYLQRDFCYGAHYTDRLFPDDRLIVWVWHQRGGTPHYITVNHDVQNNRAKETKSVIGSAVPGLSTWGPDPLAPDRSAEAARAFSQSSAVYRR